MKSVYLNRFKKEIRTWYLTQLIPRDIICNIHEPQLSKEKVNLSGRLLYEYDSVNPYSLLPKKTRSKVNVMLNYIKLIWANNDEDVYEYLINWFANMVQGNKNKSCLYAKGQEGIGKSTLPDFIAEYVTGYDLYTKGKADHLKGQHNLQLLGKLFVVFEELQFFSDKEWRAVDSEFKDLITHNIATSMKKESLQKIIITTS